MPHPMPLRTWLLGRPRIESRAKVSTMPLMYEWGDLGEGLLHSLRLDQVICAMR
jgi:hypothetical protein